MKRCLVCLTGCFLDLLWREDALPGTPPYGARLAGLRLPVAVRWGTHRGGARHPVVGRVQVRRARSFVAHGRRNIFGPGRLVLALLNTRAETSVKTVRREDRTSIAHSLRTHQGTRAISREQHKARNPI